MAREHTAVQENLTPGGLITASEAHYSLGGGGGRNYHTVVCRRSRRDFTTGQGPTLCRGDQRYHIQGGQATGRGEVL
jgi:hypothetical protein